MIRRAAASLIVLTLVGCKPNTSITLEPTIEESTNKSLASVVYTRDPSTAPQLLRGFHAVEQNAWRWTMGKFAVRLGTPLLAARDGAWVVLKFHLPANIVERYKKITLTGEIGQTALAPQSYSQAGDQEYRREAPAKLLEGDAVEVQFSLDKYMAAGVAEGRELGIIVHSIGLERK